MTTGPMIRLLLLLPVRRYDYRCCGTASITATGARNMTTGAMVRLLLLLLVRRYDYRYCSKVFTTATGAET